MVFAVRNAIAQRDVRTRSSLSIVTPGRVVARFTTFYITCTRCRNRYVYTGLATQP